MRSFSLRAQLGFIGLAYAAVMAVAAALLLGRYLQELRDPAAALASSGMWAAGDAMLTIFIVCLLMIPTIFLIWVVARFEVFYTIYSQVLLGLSLSAPVCLTVLTLGQGDLLRSLRVYFFFRLFWSPVVLLGMGVSWLAARLDRAKRLLRYALLIEGLTLAAAVALLIQAWTATGNR